MKRDIGIKLLSAFFSIVFLFGLCHNSMAADEKEEVLAQVGQYKLTLESLEEQIQSLPPQLQMALLKNPQLREQFLDRWVKITLMAEEARVLKLDQDPAIQARMKDVTNSLLAQELMRREIEGKGKVTDDEIEEYYKGHKDEFSEGESVKARHILVKVPAGADEKAWKDAESKAIDIKKKLEKGGDFAELVKEYSDDPGSKSRGGDLGFFTKGRMVPEFEAAAFSLKSGELSDPVKTTYGYHIIQVQEKKESSTKGLSEVQAQIRQKLNMEGQQKIQDDLIKRLKTKYKVKVNKDLLTTHTSPGDMPGAVTMPGKRE